jgi:hypothetical protein
VIREEQINPTRRRRKQSTREKLREHFPIMLKPEDMKPGNGRW